MPQYPQQLLQFFSPRRHSSTLSNPIAGNAGGNRLALPHTWMRSGRNFAAVLVAGLALLPLTLTQALTLEAISDFDNIAAGEAPYYRDMGGDRNVLAINAAIHAYRDVFARATTTFTGADGVYSVTITSLGEIDGEGEYRFLVNGEIVGSAVNQPVETDWGEQYHRFDNIALATGDVIAVESNAVSNGLIPENDEYAFARARWRALDLEMDTDATEAEATAEPAELALLMLYPDDSIAPGDALSLEFAISNSNASSSSIATDPRVTIELPAQFSFVASDTCSLNDNQEDGSTQLQCDLPELEAGGNSQFAIEVNVATVGEATVTATVSSSHPDSVSNNNTDSASWTIAEPAPTTETPDPVPTEVSGQEPTTPTESIDESVDESGNEPVDSTPAESSPATSTKGSGSLGLLGLVLLAGAGAGRQRRR